MARSGRALWAVVLVCVLVTTGNQAHAIGLAKPSPSGQASVAAVIEAGGVRQWVSCTGSGTTTVVIVPGLGAASDQWSKLMPQLEDITRTCVYDRPGLGHSPARAESAPPTDAGKQAMELFALLTAADEPGPYVILGHSYGGLIARAFVEQHRTKVSGVILMEGVDPREPTRGRYWHEGGQAIDMLRSRAASRGLAMHALPLLVLSASAASGDHLRDPDAPFTALRMTPWLRDQRTSTRLSSNALWVVAHSGHVVQQDNPKATREAVAQVLQSSETGIPLGCTKAWRPLDARCLPVVS